MGIKLAVVQGSVKWFPEGSHRDAPSEVLQQGATVEFKPSRPPPTAAAMEQWEKEVAKDQNAPAVGSASTVDDPTEGVFRISTDDAPVRVRLYVQKVFVEFTVTRAKPFLMVTLEGNAVTASLYGVTVA